MAYIVTQTHPMIKVAWIAMTCVYKVSELWTWVRITVSEIFFSFQAARAQQQVDKDARQLAEDLSSLLAYATACRDLPPINGREAIVDRVVALTKEGACLIDESMAYDFVSKLPSSRTWNNCSACLSQSDTSYIGRAALGPVTGIEGQNKRR